MRLVCIRARHRLAVGDVVEVPDGAGFSGLYFEPAPAAAPPPKPVPAPAAPETPKAVTP